MSANLIVMEATLVVRIPKGDNDPAVALAAAIDGIGRLLTRIGEPKVTGENDEVVQLSCQLRVNPTRGASGVLQRHVPVIARRVNALSHVIVDKKRRSLTFDEASERVSELESLMADVTQPLSQDTAESLARWREWRGELGVTV